MLLDELIKMLPSTTDDDHGDAIGDELAGEGFTNARGGSQDEDFFVRKVGYHFAGWY